MAKQSEKRVTTLHQQIFRSDLGPIQGLSTEYGLCYLGFQEKAHSAAQAKNDFLSFFLNKFFPNAKILKKPNTILAQTQDWLAGYFTKAVAKLILPALDLRGSSFSKQGLTRLMQLPPGKTKSYGEFAKELGNPLASRAVGRMMNQNPIGLIIPCHRIIGQNGQLTGYRGGLERKAWLLNFEGCNLV